MKNSTTPTPEKPVSRPISVGQFYLNIDTDNAVKHPYILSQVDFNKVCLIGIKNGNRWQEPITIRNPHDITKEEFDRISLGFHSRFERMARREVLRRCYS